MLCIILISDPMALLAITLFFLCVAYAQLFLFNYLVLCKRPDLQFDFRTVLTFPFYKMATTLLFRQYALMENVISYSLNLKPHTIEHRLTTQKQELNGKLNIPPTP